ncbi:MAG: phytase [Pseudomonadota bacterium]
MSTEIRVASFNASLNRNNAGDLITDLSDGSNAQAQAVAEIIQRTDADIILINEFDFDAEGEAASLFQQNYLSVDQNGAGAIDYPHVFVAPSNTGVPSGVDLDASGAVGDFAPGDAQGFGFFEGQFGFIILSKHPIDEENIRTFQNFLWKDLPGNLLLNDPTDNKLIDLENPENGFYDPEVADVFRLSSKNHVDLPVIVDGETVHVLAAHPTPPVFDGAEDRNGKRNHDEIKFWADYVNGTAFTDDNGVTASLDDDARFVIVGDYNADPFDGDSFDSAINQLLDNPNILGSATDAAITPNSEGGVDSTERQAGFNETHEGNPAFDTADFGFNGFTDGVQNPDASPGNLRVDYALPSVEGFDYLGGSVFWQAAEDPLFPLAEFPTSDHRLVSVDLEITDIEDPSIRFDDKDRRVVDAVEFLGVVEIPSGTEFDGTIIGGLSSIVFDLESGTYLTISDDRGAGEDGTPRFYEVDIDLSDGALDEGDVVFTDVTAFTIDGETFDVLNPDPEGIAIGADGQLFISTERNIDGRIPQLFKVDRDGTITDELPVDDRFKGLNDFQGVPNNNGFESLTVTPDTKFLYTATESTLIQDGPRSNFETGAFSRVIKYDTATGEAVAEFLYPIDPIAVEIEGTPFADNGLVELIALDNQGTFLALERSFTLGAEDRGYTGNLYLVRSQGATNVIGQDVETFIEDGELEANVDEIATKELLLNLDDLGIVIDNIEGLALGPVLEDGRQSLIINSDDNFSAFGPQANQFIALALDLSEIPTIEPVLETPSELRYDEADVVPLDERPIVIAHRGFSAERPEHTLEAYQLAIDAGADFIEPDLVTTSDGVLIARHEPFLATVETDENGEIVRDEDGNPVVNFQTTNVADLPEFADRLTTKQLNAFTSVTGWFAEDFTLEEIKTLRAREDQPDLRPQSAAFDDQFEIPTLAEVIDLVQAHEAATGEKIGIYPETKDPSFFDAQGLSLEEPLIQTLIDEGFTDPERIFIQSFEIQNLLDLQFNIMPEAGIDLPLIQLVFNFADIPPIDLFAAQQAGDLSAYEAIEGIEDFVGLSGLLSEEGLAALADAYAEGIGAPISLVIDDNGASTGLTDAVSQAGLLTHVYTHRDETTFVTLEGEEFQGEDFYQLLLEAGVDGIFTDNPDTGRDATDAFFEVEEGPDSDDAAIWYDNTNPAYSMIVTTHKNGGLRVYDLEGEELQRIEPEGIRYNNVDVLYDVGPNRVKFDLAIASDRENDTLAIFKINRQTGEFEDVTAPSIPDSIFGIDDGEQTAYGLAAYQSPVDGEAYVFVTQADGSQIAQLRLVQERGQFTYETVRMLDLPVAEGDDPADYQSEGIVIDRETGIGYVAVEEELGLLAFEAELGGSDDFEIIAPIDADFFEPDLEGVAIHYGEEGEGLIVVSSQGDSTYAVFDRISYEFQGSFAIRGDHAEIDGVEETDGIEILSTGLPGFESGILITHDGSNDPEAVFQDPEDGELQNFNTNFKFSDLGDVLEIFDQPANPEFDPQEIAPHTLVNGIGSGDVTTESVILWARSLAVGEVTFEIRELGTARVLQTLTAEVTDTDVPVKLLVEGLEDGTDYTYTVTDAAGDTDTGRFITAAEDGSNGLNFGITGDWRGDLAPYPAVSNVAEQELDFFVLGGDNIYADFDSPANPSDPDALFPDQAVTLDDFRSHYDEVYGGRAGENYFKDLKESTSVFATIDDHEVTNDFAGGGIIGETAEDEFRALFPEDDQGGFVNDSTLYENGLQAWQEWHPIADEFYGETGDDRTAEERKLYRNQEFGQDGAVFILDQRSFRDEQIDPFQFGSQDDLIRFQTESFDPTRTLLGEAQLEELKTDLLAAEENGVTWKFIYSPEPFQNLGLNNADSWEGYQAERTEILQFIDENEIDNVVFVAADIHATFVNNITYQEQPFGPQIATSAFEITTGSVAFDPTFGEGILDAAAGLGLISPEELAIINSLPIAPDGDGIPNDRDDVVRDLFNDVTLTPLGLDPLGLDDNLEIADGLIDAELLQGGWVSSFTFGWTEFEIDADTQALTVTTYGIESYSPEEAGSAEVLAREPEIVSQFVVQADLEDQLDVNIIEATAVRETLQATVEIDVFEFETGDSTVGAVDRIQGFEAGDQIDLSDFGFTEAALNRWHFDDETVSVRQFGEDVVLSNLEQDPRFRLIVEDTTVAEVAEGLILDANDTLLF